MKFPADDDDVDDGSDDDDDEKKMQEKKLSFLGDAQLRLSCTSSAKTEVGGREKSQVAPG